MPTSSIYQNLIYRGNGVYKLCSKCKDELQTSKFFKSSILTSGFLAACKECTYKVTRKNLTTEARQKQNIKMREINLRSQRKARVLLTDTHLKKKLIDSIGTTLGVRLKFSDITQDMIDLKRAELKLTKLVDPTHWLKEKTKLIAVPGYCSICGKKCEENDYHNKGQGRKNNYCKTCGDKRNYQHQKRFKNSNEKDKN